MKKILLALSAVALLFATSCKKENINPAVDVPEGSFLATIDNGANPQNAPRINDGMGTMTTIDTNRYVIWENGDQIKINGESYITNTTGSSVVFNPVDITKQATGTPFNAFYPASLVTAEGYRLPATQDIVLDDNNNITVRNLPMYATSTTNQLTFNNICAVLKVTIPEGVTNCNKLVLHADKNICGTFQMNGNVAELTDKTGSDNNTITVNAPQGNNFSNSKPVYVAIPAGTYTFSIELKNGDDKLFDSKTVTDKTLEVNKIYNVNISQPQVAGICFEALAANSSVTMNASTPGSYVYSVDAGANWNDLPKGTAISLSTVGAKAYIKVKGTNNRLFFSTSTGVFSGAGQLKVSGNIMYLLNGTTPATVLVEGTADGQNNSAFYNLFKGNTALVDASDLLLPAETLSTSCYRAMFSGCTALTAAPSLPATNLKDYCYADMFYGCSALKKAPSMVVNSFSQGSSSVHGGQCYRMFYGCSVLDDISGVTLSASQLVNDCYSSMFYGCSKMKSAPVLYATTLAEMCYNQMFKNCSLLESVTINATSIGNVNMVQNWLNNAGPTPKANNKIYVTNTNVQTWFNTTYPAMKYSWTVELKQQ